ncbi:MAG: GvpL/GvpF family gas vesicle protein [Acidobacteria bacterium]|nr:GvpL/GvpF family gas vesicle protein [Acidobacteriota bacterium]
MSTTAIYVYCVVRGAKRSSRGRVPRGLPGSSAPSLAPLSTSVSLIVGEVPLELYGTEQLERGLRDLDWVGAAAMAHEAVVEHFARQTGVTVIPMKLFTMFSSQARATAEMKRRRPELDEVFARLRGCEEWGVRIAGRRATPGTKRPPGVAPSGTAFLTARKQARDKAREEIRMAAEAAEAAYDVLAAHARDSRRRDDVPDAASAPPLLDAAFLIPASRRARFRATARRAAAACAQAGAAMTLSGPWPAYNFVDAQREPQ